MRNIDIFEVLVVYSHGIALSASKDKPNKPFPDIPKRASYNTAYAYFLTTCAKNNLSAAFTTSIDLGKKRNLQ